MKKLTHRIGSIWGAAKIASILLALGAVSASGQTGERKLFANSVVPLPATRGFSVHGLKPEQANDKMEIHFSLEMRNVSELQEKIEKGDSVGPEEMERDYLPLPSDYERLLSWLKEEGFEITETSGDRTDIYARGTLARIEKSLQVKMVNVTVEGVTYDSAKTAPSLPSDIGAHVLGINGLQPFLKAHRQSVKFTPHSTGFIRSGGSPTPADPGLSPNIANMPPYIVSEVLGAYNANNLPVTGAGQKIAILIDTVPDDEDLKAFWTNNKLPVTLRNIEKIIVNGGSLPTPEGEETLDVEWSTGAAPGATVRVYAAGSLSFVDLDKALDRIIADLATQPGMHQLSISLGLGEGFIDRNEVAAEHLKFLRLAARGVNTFVASGDAGSNPDITGHSSSGPLQVEYQSSDPAVVGVGGTSLVLDSTTGALTSESGWVASGGGKSQIFDRPKWQTGTGIPAGDKRLVPDVSLAADPNTGAYVFFQGKVQQYGGTSWSAPTWAGFCALINNARAKASKKPLPFLCTLIYPLIGTGNFREIKDGSNGAYSAGPGFNMVAGVGVPDVALLLRTLSE